MDFAQRLKKLREDRCIKQADLANILNISMQSISAYENGREPNFELLCKMADYYEVSTDYLLGRSTFKNPENVSFGKNSKLSDKAIDNIKNWGNHLSEGWTLDYLFTDERFSDLLSSLGMYSWTSEGTLANICNMLIEIDKVKGSPLQKTLKNKQSKIQFMLDTYLNGAIGEFRDMVKDMRKEGQSRIKSANITESEFLEAMQDENNNA